MKFNRKLIIKAHKLAKGIKKEYPEVNYQFQFGISMKYLLSEIKGVEKVMKSLEYGKLYLVEDLITAVNPDGKSVRFYSKSKKFQGEEDITSELLKDVEKEIETPAGFNFKIRITGNTYSIKETLKKLGAKFIDYPEKEWILDYGTDVSMFLKSSINRNKGIWAETFLEIN